MEVVNRPIVEFYRESLSDAYKKGFLWVVTLLAREVDVDGLYLNLRKSWLSLDSITGKYFLFVFAGKENTTDDAQWNSRVVNSQGRYEYNAYIKFINSNLESESLYVQDRNINMLEENQTIAVNALRDYFSIDESDIPCLVFTRLHPFNLSTDSIQVISISGNDIYKYFKHLFNKIDPLLKQHMKMSICLNELEKHKKELKEKITQNFFKLEGNILELQRELLSSAEENIVDVKGRTLRECIDNLSYGKFDIPLRSKLNRYIDLVKDYENKIGKKFDSSLIEDAYSQSMNAIAQIKNELSIIDRERHELVNTSNDILFQIDNIIGGSKMNENTKRDSRVSISTEGGDITN